MRSTTGGDAEGQASSVSRGPETIMILGTLAGVTHGQNIPCVPREGGAKSIWLNPRKIDQSLHHEQRSAQVSKTRAVCQYEPPVGDRCSTSYGLGWDPVKNILKSRGPFGSCESLRFRPIRRLSAVPALPKLARQP